MCVQALPQHECFCSQMPNFKGFGRLPTVLGDDFLRVLSNAKSKQLAQTKKHAKTTTCFEPCRKKHAQAQKCNFKRVGAQKKMLDVSDEGVTSPGRTQEYKKVDPDDILKIQM